MTFARGLALVSILALSMPAVAQGAVGRTQGIPAQNDAPLGIVTIGDHTTFRLPPVGSMSGEQRANTVRQAILSTLHMAERNHALGTFNVEDAVQVGQKNHMPIITLNGQPIVSVTGVDTRFYDLSADELAKRWEQDLKTALADMHLNTEGTVANLDERVTVAVSNVGEPIVPEGAPVGSDAQIASRVQQAIRSAPNLRDARVADAVRVEVVNGVVFLRGNLANQDLENQLVEHIQNLPHVKAVVNELAVGSPGRDTERR